ncbi:MAG: hypothetical protein HOP33_08685 [Verrucomicrobia bacterium]|nr:hypothetical protein [Verrucomicrobiota bacterium]
MNVRTSLFLGSLLIACAQFASAAPVQSSWPVVGFDDSAAVGAARLSGIYAVGDSYENNVEVRDIRQNLLRTISTSEIQALLPWMSLDGGPDGPSGLAVSDSGRQVFILVHDDTVAGDGGASDGVILYDSYDNALRLFARVNLFDRGDIFPLLAAKHYKGKLYVGTASDGIKVFSAGLNDLTGTLLATAPLPDGSPVCGLAIDPDQNLIFAASTNTIYRAIVTNSPLSFTAVGSISDIRAIAFSLNYGGSANAGLYVLAGAGTTSLQYVSVNQARGLQAFSPTTYIANLGVAFDVAATACGRLLVGADEDAVLISDNSDTLLSFDGWLTNEFDQVVVFCKSLLAADGHGPGWVTDADTQQGLPRFHPCTPDGACWVTLALMLADEIRHDPDAQNLVRDIMVRHAGQAADGIVPSKSADGIFRHWINPANGGTLGTWDPEFATLSTMKIDLAAARARKYYWTNTTLRTAASIIIDGVSNRSAYVRSNPAALYFKGLAGGGPDLTSTGAPFHEGILFVEQLATFDDNVNPRYANWLNRSLWPVAQMVVGKTVTGNGNGQFQAAFVSLYPWLLQKDFRDSTSWSQSVDNLWYSHAAWNDANGPRYFTVFSAGTTPTGYNADSLSSHPNDIATFPSLMAFCGKGNTLPAVAAYQAYRRGARQTFLGGASMLYRRSNPDPSWQPNSAGLPDVVLGGIGLAELLQPGVVDKLLALDMSGYPIQLTRQGSQLELSWPLIGGWRVQETTNFTTWVDSPAIPNPYRFDPDRPNVFYRITR